MDAAKIRVVFEYEFRRRTTAAETTRRVLTVFGEGSTTERTVNRWYKRFQEGEFELAN